VQQISLNHININSQSLKLNC